MLIVILVFLQSWRALLVPATTVPVTIIGAFAFMPLLGFSINLLTLFGLILAIGIVVDDAIVIVENASHHIERGVPPREATIQAMNEVTGPVISITLVLMAVFLPTAFLRRHHRADVPAVRADDRGDGAHQRHQRADAQAGPVRGVAAAGRRRRGWFTRAFDAVYRPVERGYAWCVRHLLRVWWLVLLVFVGVAVVTGVVVPARRRPGFLPDEDQGYVIIAVQLPDAASLDRTREVDGRHEQGRSASTPGRRELVRPRRVLAARRHGRAERGDRVRRLEGLDEADDAGAPAGGAGRAAPGASSAQMQEASVLVLVPPSIQGLGFAGGFQMQIEDREGVGLDALQDATQAVIDAGGASGRRSNRAGSEHVPGRRAADLPEHRPREGREDGRDAGRRLRHPAGEPRVGVRQRLQQVRPDVPGARAGGRPRSAATRA